MTGVTYLLTYSPCRRSRRGRSDGTRVLGERGDPHRAVHLEAVVAQVRVPRAAERLSSRIKDGAL